MKKNLFLLAILLIVSTVTKAQYDGDWNEIRSENGVIFSSNTRCYDKCSTKLYFIRLENNSYSTIKEVRISNIEFYDGGILIARINGGSAKLKPGEDRYGENSGLWWNIPKGYENKKISARMVGLTVVDKLN